MRTVIRGGTVVSADGAELADVLIEDEVVAAIAAFGLGIADAWQQDASQVVDVVPTDHCPFCFAEQKELGVGDFTKIPNGLPGVEHRMDLIYQGVVANEISLSRWVDVTSTTPAKMFGLYPKKGTIAPGSDADIVVYDPAATQTISAATHHMAVDYSCYEGMEITGRVEWVFSRGRAIIEDNAYKGSAGHGRFVPRQLCQGLR
jgi:dihydropyrimidinase